MSKKEQAVEVEHPVTVERQKDIIARLEETSRKLSDTLVLEQIKTKALTKEMDKHKADVVDAAASIKHLEKQAEYLRTHSNQVEAAARVADRELSNLKKQLAAVATLLTALAPSPFSENFPKFQIG